MTIHEVNKLFFIIKCDIKNIWRCVVRVQSLLKHVRIHPNIEIDQLIRVGIVILPLRQSLVDLLFKFAVKIRSLDDDVLQISADPCVFVVSKVLAIEVWHLVNCDQVHEVTMLRIKTNLDLLAVFEHETRHGEMVRQRGLIQHRISSIRNICIEVEEASQLFPDEELLSTDASRVVLGEVHQAESRLFPTLDGNIIVVRNVLGSGFLIRNNIWIEPRER